MSGLNPFLSPGVIPRNLLRSSLSKPEQDRVNTLLRQISNNVFNRSDYTCEFCGYHEDVEVLVEVSNSTGAPRLKSHLDVIFKDGDVKNIAIENLATACAFCAPIMGLNSIPSNQTWHLAWLPLYQQTWISNVSVALMFLKQMLEDYDNAGDQFQRNMPVLKTYAQVLTSYRAMLFDELRGAVRTAQMRLGITNAVDFGSMLEKLLVDHPTEYARRHEYFRGFLIIPDGLLRNDWSGFNDTLPAVKAGGSLAGIVSLWDLIALGKQSYLLAYQKKAS